MNIHEYQAKLLLAKNGVPAPAGSACTTVGEAVVIAEKLFASGQKQVIVKAQIHAGGRGKGVFKSGLHGGVKLCKTVDDVYRNAKAMFGQMLVTKQTGPEGRRVSRLLIESASAIKRECYLAVLLDRTTSRPVMMVSTEGGMDIEEIAEKTPEKIIRETIDPAIGLMPYQARKLAFSLGFTGDLLHQASKLLQGVYRTWEQNEATLVETNPLCLVEQPDGTVSLVVDAKMSFDDNALFRHPEIRQMRDLAEESPLETEASKFNLNYIKLDGDIACLVNGAGLAMATMDIIVHYGGRPANFLDVGGSASREQVAAGLKIILSGARMQAILVNIFGGIMQCDTIAHGILAAARENSLTCPVVVRLAGTNADLGRKILLESGLPLLSADSLAEAADKAVKAAVSNRSQMAAC
ncbi:MAG: ADP-forming succinate--CoA ligase subunit beta [Candidatus Omnitrophica bacterium]|nr:ADP-forming succinate--CoA ligase subunit beta [Candidatus Omnitrophota bacterium]